MRMNLGVISGGSHMADIHPNIILPYTETNLATLDAVKVNLAVQGFIPKMVKLERDLSYDLLFRQLWAEGKPFIIVEHDIIPWPGALVQLWKCNKPWCGFPYFVFGELRNYLGCTKFDPLQLGECPLSGNELVPWQRVDKAVEQSLMSNGHRGHLHGPPVTHLNIHHSRMRENVMINPFFWEAHVAM